MTQSGNDGLKLIPLILLSVSLFALAAQGATPGSSNRYSTMADSMLDMMGAFTSAYQKRGNAAGNQRQGNAPGPQGMPSMPSMPSWSPGSMPMQMGTMGMMSSMPTGWGGTPWSQGSMPSWPQGSMPSWPQGSMPSWPQGATPSWPQEYMPWAQPSPAADASYGQGYQQPFYSQDVGGQNAELGGRWQGNRGELLMIRNGRFRIYQDQERFKEGNLGLEGQNMLTMQDPVSGNVRRYEYALQGDKLALRDQAGNLLLYRRIQ